MKYVVLLLITSFLINCASTQKEITENQKIKLEKIVNEKSFSIASNMVYPRVTSAMMSLQNAGLFPVNSTASMIDISSNDNYLIFKNDSVKAYLPYFGERQMGAAYGSNNSQIEFDGVPRDYTLTKTKKGNYRMKFKIKDKNTNTESYNVNVLIYPNLSTRINILSTHRFSIEYSGLLTEETAVN